MNTKQLQYFLTTAKQGSITAASRVLDIAQPSISLQIANLEHELKIKLFERGSRGVELTKAGAKFQERARTILQHMNAAKIELKESSMGSKSRVAVGLGQPSSSVPPRELFAELERRFPDFNSIYRVDASS